MSVSTISAVLNQNNEFNCSDRGGYTGEHNAQMLEITLNDEFASEAYDYITVALDTCIHGGKSVSNEIRDGNDTPFYRIDNKIYCPLSQSLTSSGRLKVQLSAHTVEDLQVINIRKTGILELEFMPSVMGCGSGFDCSAGLVERIYAALTVIGELSGSLTALESSLQTAVSQLEGSISSLQSGQEALDSDAAQTKSALTEAQADIAEIEADIAGITANIAGVEPITAGAYLSLADGVMSVKTSPTLNYSTEYLPTASAIKLYIDDGYINNLAQYTPSVIAATVATLAKAMDTHCVGLYKGSVNVAVTAVAHDAAVISIFETDNYFYIVPYGDSTSAILNDISYMFIAGNIYKVSYDAANDCEMVTEYTPADFSELLGIGM